MKRKERSEFIRKLRQRQRDDFNGGAKIFDREKPKDTPPPVPVAPTAAAVPVPVDEAEEIIEQGKKLNPFGTASFRVGTGTVE